MVDTAVPDMNPASALTGAELFYGVQSGANVKIAADLISTFIRNYNSGAITVDAPALNLAQEWNNAAVAFRGLKFNATDTNSAAGSLLMDLQVGTASKFNVAKSGLVRSMVADTSLSYGFATSLSANAGFAIFDAHNIQMFDGDNYATVLGACAGSVHGLYTRHDCGFGFSAGPANVPDALLTYDAAGIIAQRNSTNVQTFRVYNTYTDASNYERATFDWNITANKLTIGTEAAGTGTARGINITSASMITTFTGTFNPVEVNTNAGTVSCIDGSSTIKTMLDVQKGVKIASDRSLGFSPDANASSNADTIFLRDAAGILAQRDGTNAQALRVYNTYTDASNYERGVFDWQTTSNTLRIGSEKLGSGTGRDLQFVVGGTERIRIDNSGEVLVGLTTAQIPNTSAKFASCYQTDAYNSGLVVLGWNAYATSVDCFNTRGGSPTAHSAAGDGGNLHAINFRASDGVSAWGTAARIWVQQEGAYASASTPGRIIIGTTPSSSIVAVERARFDSKGNIVFGGSLGALATTATDGFVYFPGCAGVPTGVPSYLPTGLVPLIIDTTDSRIYGYWSSAWHQLT